MLDPGRVLGAARRYIRSHPEEITRALRSSFGLRFGVPLAAFRWLIEQVVKDAEALDVELAGEPPGLRFGASLNRMETLLRVSGVLYVNRVDVSADQIRVELRFERVGMRVLSAKRTVVSALINSGALNISKIGNLVHELPGLPPLVVEAHDNILAIDIMRSRALEQNPWVRHIVGMMSSLVTVHGVETDPEHLDVVFRALPRGGTAAVGAFRHHMLSPGIRKVSSVLGLADGQTLPVPI